MKKKMIWLLAIFLLVPSFGAWAEESAVSAEYSLTQILMQDNDAWTTVSIVQDCESFKRTIRVQQYLPGVKGLPVTEDIPFRSEENSLYLTKGEFSAPEHGLPFGDPSYRYIFRYEVGRRAYIGIVNLSEYSYEEVLLPNNCHGIEQMAKFREGFLLTAASLKTKSRHVLYCSIEGKTIQTIMEASLEENQKILFGYFYGAKGARNLAYLCLVSKNNRLEVFSVYDINKLERLRTFYLSPDIIIDGFSQGMSPYLQVHGHIPVNFYVD